MKLHKQLLMVAALMLWVVLPSIAQVEMAALRTKGIECGFCAAASEITLRGIEGVDKVTISRSQESVMIAYGADAPFEPEEIRGALAPFHVGIEQFQVRARGHIEESGDQRFFIAGEERFLLASSVVKGEKVPSGIPVVIEAVLEDQLSPMELSVLSFKLVEHAN